ncbi:two-component system sensor histidine kinase KdbD, partial [Salmonella enterica subsp. salamae]|nr:two-component system sensor histidine kinase KdbD [Salmonella enterica subsp. salamae]
RLAQELGAETATLSDPAEEKAVVRYAREHNLGKIVMGRPASRRWWRRNAFADRLARRAPDLDQVIVALEEPPARALTQAPDNRPFKEKWRGQIQGCLVAVALCAITTLIAMQWLVTFDAANLVMLYLLGVVVIALLYGRWPSVVATVINVASFDLFFIAPRGTLAVSDVQYLLTFAVMLTVGLVIGNLTAGVRYQARVARYREQRTRHLYEMSKALAVGRSEHDIAATSERFIASTFQARSQILLPDANGKLLPLTHQQGMTPWDDAIARWSFDKGQPAGAGTDTLPGVPYQILPLKSADKTYGLAIVEPGNLRQLMVPEQQRLLETFTLLVANALERLTLTASEEQARLASERESIRNALLAALSHDLRTPLTVLFGQAEILTLDLASAGSPHARQASEIRQHILNTTRLVNNLLDMARIQSGGFNLKKEWLTLEEVVGSALQMLEPGLLHPITLSLPQQLTLIHVDGPLFERVLINLLENAVKYAGPQASIGIDAAVKDDRLQLDVWDNGPGIPAGQEQKIFDKFARGNKESAVPGVGLGLAICHAIVEVHDGTLTAYNRPQGGACFRVTLPQGKPPELDDFHEDM